MDECLPQLRTLGWNSACLAPGCGMMTLKFASLLAEAMISGDILDLMIKDFTYRVQHDQAAAQHYEIVGLSFMDEINRLYKTSSAIMRPFAQQVQERLKTAPKALLLPVHDEKHLHYVAIMMDFEAGTIKYGTHLVFWPCVLVLNGLSKAIHCSTKAWKKPTDSFRALQWWSSTHFGRTFKDLGCVMEYGCQDDAISCAITTANMIAHAALGDPLWNISRADHERAIWFTKLVKLQMRFVSSFNSQHGCSTH
jgi:hypothetical protein